ncbi:MAG TPA: hypothetical protein DGA22_00300 [Acidobacterium sp.]|nr:hypothetical protein [Acidobacterium sp.]
MKETTIFSADQQIAAEDDSKINGYSQHLLLPGRVASNGIKLIAPNDRQSKLNLFIHRLALSRFSGQMDHALGILQDADRSRKDYDSMA